MSTGQIFLQELLEVWERQDEDFVETNHSAQVVVDHVPQQLELLLGEIYVDSLVSE